MTASMRTCLLLLSLLLAPMSVLADAAPPPVVRDGAHDFDFGIGVFKTHIRRLKNPLTGSTTWTEWNGTVSTRKVWGGKGQLEELEIDGPQGAHIQGMTLRLYNPEAHQWNLYWANSGDGTLGQPVIGDFKDGRGEFYDQEQVNGRTIWVRNVYSGVTPDSYDFEQAFSADGGKTWEPNFVASLTRVAADVTPEAEAANLSAGEHGFDWQLGHWGIHMRRMLHPLSKAETWTTYDGRVDVARIWGGKANLAEIEVTGPTGPLEFLSLRLYNPDSHQWTLNFAHSGNGTVGSPMYGEFKNGRGEFYDQSLLDGRAILERFVFEVVKPGNTRDEQAFSADGGKTWETNWINTQAATKAER